MPTGKVVGLICDDQLYVKILPASAELEKVCDKDEAYPGSKPYYVVEESMLSQLRQSAGYFDRYCEVSFGTIKKEENRKPSRNEKAVRMELALIRYGFCAI